MHWCEHVTVCGFHFICLIMWSFCIMHGGLSELDWNTTQFKVFDLRLHSRFGNSSCAWEQLMWQQCGESRQATRKRYGRQYFSPYVIFFIITFQVLAHAIVIFWAQVWQYFIGYDSMGILGGQSGYEIKVRRSTMKLIFFSLCWDLFHYIDLMLSLPLAVFWHPWCYWQGCVSPSPTPRFWLFQQTWQITDVTCQRFIKRTRPHFPLLPSAREKSNAVR